MKNVCIFGASRSDIDQRYFACARRTGELLAEHGIGMVFGGGTIGLMGAAAEGAHSRGGKVTGVIPEKLNRPGIAYERCDELIVTPTMHQRKATMESLSDGYIALPGGFGTLEELLEVLTLNQLGYMASPVAILDLDGLYAPILAQLRKCVDENFTDQAYLSLYKSVGSPEEAVEYLLNYKPAEMPDKIEDSRKR
jgi:uncharacterized protein (TIGR00730 family)